MDMQTTRERRQERTRQDILSAAIAIIAEDGADHLSLREIARRIDYSPAALYRFFGSKEDIMDAVCTEANERLTASLSAVRLSLPVREYLTELGMAYIRFAKNYPQHFMFIANFAPEVAQGVSREAAEQAVTDPSDCFSLLYNAIDRGISEGVIAAREGFVTLEIAYSLWALVHGLSLLEIKRLSGLPLDFEHADRQAIMTYIDGLGCTT